MALDKSIQEDDRVFEQDEFKIVISKEYDKFYKNLQIDWVDNFRGRGFHVFDSVNPGC